MIDYPRMVYHADSRSQVVTHEREEQALGDGWSREPAEHHVEGFRRASGVVSEIVHQGEVVVPSPISTLPRFPVRSARGPAQAA